MHISAAERVDTLAVAALLEELDRFYGGTGFAPQAERATRVERELFGALPAAHVLLAREGERVVGLAACSFVWPASGLSRSLFLKELFVSGPYRNAGVGRALMAAVRDFAIAHDCCRVDWTAERSNDAAQRFYASLGAVVLDDKAFHRLDLAPGPSPAA